jgi:hypothetical protein
VNIERQASCRQLRVTATAAADRWDRTALREKLNEQDVGQILQEVKAGQPPEWKDIADCNLIYKGYWA